jgi:ABC-2 type transport system ATP-binding protein
MKPAVNLAALELNDIGVRYRVPVEPMWSVKEYAIRRIQGRVSYRDIWALRNIDLAVRTGEVVGIVGPNGAGKSTLLRLLARVIAPTSGRVRVFGHVAPLLDVGAGFHPDLTGRENVFMNATLLGHSRREVAKRFDSIVEFSEMSEFIDAPLRAYSSGMWARLGFAVATAWQPDVLLVDEVLAVGDESFRAKCAVRIREFREDGATTILVSHSLALVQSMCERVVWLDHGKVQAIGPAHEVTSAYHARASLA